MTTTRKSPETRVKQPARLSDPLNQRLNGYALAAGAAGVALLACSAPAAEAAPVCKDLSVQLFHNNTYALNPAGQAFAPFNVAQSTVRYSGNGYSYSFVSWNRAFFSPNSAGAQVLLDSKGFPVDVAAGASIGPGGQFGKGASYGLMFTYGKGPGPNSGRGTLQKHQGNIVLQQVNYVGFQFSQAGSVHYGWARLKVGVGETYWGKRTLIKLLGYGYEPTANTGIAAGSCTATPASKAGTKSSGAVSDATSQDAPPAPALSMLALGSNGLSLWRMKK
jgi:hypothetical protein